MLDERTKSAYASFLVAYAVVTRKIDRKLRESGVVGIDIYDVLLALEDAPGQKLRMSELADRLVISRSGITRLADRLEKEGLLRRVACPQDRRSMFASLTAKGLAERERAWPVYRDAIAEYFGKHVSCEDAGVLRKSMDNLIGQDPEVAQRFPACREDR